MATSIIERIVYEVDDAAGTSGSGGAGGAGRAGGAVLCIHGLGGSSNTWTPLMPALQRHRVIRIDLPGSGRSCHVDGDLSIGRFTRACLRVMAACQAEQVHVLPGCGHWTPVERPDACMELLRRFQPRRTN